MLMLSMLHDLLSQVLSPPHLHTALLFTPAGELVSVACEPTRSKDEIRVLVGVSVEVWQETKDEGCGMVDSELGRIIVLPVEEPVLQSDEPFLGEREPLMLLALNATDAAEWDELDNMGRVLAQHLAQPLSKFRDFIAPPKPGQLNGAMSPSLVRM